MIRRSEDRSRARGRRPRRDPDRHRDRSRSRARGRSRRDRSASKDRAKDDDKEDEAAHLPAGLRLRRRSGVYEARDGRASRGADAPVRETPRARRRPLGARAPNRPARRSARARRPGAARPGRNGRRAFARRNPSSFSKNRYPSSSQRLSHLRRAGAAVAAPRPIQAAPALEQHRVPP